MWYWRKDRQLGTDFKLYLFLIDWVVISLFLQSLGCLLYAIAFFKSPFDIVLERGDSVALAVQSGPSNAKFPKNSPFSKGFQDLILWMLTVDLQKRPFINDVITKVALLIETSEDQLWCYLKMYTWKPLENFYNSMTSKAPQLSLPYVN